MAATGEGTPAHFVKVEEDKSQRKGRSRLIRYFLVDSEGNRTLAAVGEEAAQGDAHYKYYNHPSFDAHGELTCHNRKDLNAWLDRVIADSRVAAGLPPTDGSEAVNVNLPADAPPWVDSRQERFTQEGKRGARYYLIDASGRETLAASGTERGSGQYAFNSTPYFDAFYPLKAGNMSTTQRWLGDVVAASMAVHGRADGVGAGAHRKAQPGAKRGSEPRLGGAAEASHLKRLRMMQMEQDSKARSGQNLALEVLREECGRERLRRMLLRHTAAVMLQDEDAATPAVTNEALAGHVEVLDRYADQLEGGGGGRGGAAVDERAAAVALHAVASRQLTFRTVSQFDLVPLLRRLARAWAPPHEACTAAPAVLFPGAGTPRTTGRRRRAAAPEPRAPPTGPRAGPQQQPDGARRGPTPRRSRRSPPPSSTASAARAPRRASSSRTRASSRTPSSSSTRPSRSGQTCCTCSCTGPTRRGPCATRSRTGTAR
ncbi:unnamed protein product [Pedinophyceae sp. YPF-701]|nr:unnamed protein product [Pedinophyceae sp. YPF-701]